MSGLLLNLVFRGGLCWWLVPDLVKLYGHVFVVAHGVIHSVSVAIVPGLDCPEPLSGSSLPYSSLSVVMYS